MSGKGKGKKGQRKNQSAESPVPEYDSTAAASAAASASASSGNVPPTDALQNLTVNDPAPPPLVNSSNSNLENANKSAPLNNGHVPGIDNANLENDSSADDPSSEQAAADKRNREKKHDAGAADLERVTDYAEETEITESDISGVMGLIGEEVAGRLERERIIAKKIQLRKEDIEILVNEFEISRERAEQVLREHEGSLKKALYTLTE